MLKSNSRKERILLELGRYKLLTRKQMSRLGLGDRNSYYTEPLKYLERINFIGVYNVDKIATDNVYYLREKGKNYLVHNGLLDDSVINYYKKAPAKSSNNIFHITAIVSLHIEFIIYCSRNNITPITYLRDIDTVGAVKKGGLKAKTTVIVNGKKFMPDSIIYLSTEKGRKLFSLEFENTSKLKDSLEKIKVYLEMYKTENLQLSKLVDHDKAWRILFVFANEVKMRRFMDECNRYSGIGKWILFKTLDNSLARTELNKGVFITSEEKDLHTGWLTASGKFAELF